MINIYLRQIDFSSSLRKKLKGQNPFGKQSDEIMKRVCKTSSRARTELGTSSLQRRCCLKKSLYGTATKRSITQRLCHFS
jgi:hypothetical protein